MCRCFTSVLILLRLRSLVGEVETGEDGDIVRSDPFVSPCSFGS